MRIRVGGVFVVAVGLALGVAPRASAQPGKRECISDNESAQDLRHAGKLLEARAKLAECVSPSCPGPVRQDCAQRLAEVEAATPTLVFAARDGAGRDLAAVTVTMDGKPFAARLDGSALAVDPGEHTFAFDAQGQATVRSTLVVREGEKGRRESVTFGPGAASPPAPAAVPQANPASSSSSPPPASSDSNDASSPPGSTQRLAGLVVGGVGVVGVAVGSVFAFVSKSTYDNALKNECGNNANACSSQGQQDGSTAHNQATVATVGLAAGAALVAAGAVLYLTAPSVSVTPTVGVGRAGVTVGVTW
jgi:hypothetical protein